MVRNIPTYTVELNMADRTLRVRFASQAQAIAAARRWFQGGEPIWVNVIRRDRRGYVTYVWNDERKPTDAERAVMLERLVRIAA